MIYYKDAALNLHVAVMDPGILKGVSTVSISQMQGSGGTAPSRLRGFNF